MRDARHAQPAAQINARRTVARDANYRANRIGIHRGQVFQKYALFHLFEGDRPTIRKQRNAIYPTPKPVDGKSLSRPPSRQEI